MSGSVARPFPVPVGDPWLASMDVLDCSAEIIEAAGSIGAAGNTLFSTPGNINAQNDAEAAARRVLAVVGRLRAVMSAADEYQRSRQ